MLNLPTFADRVWFAWHCLPRDERGRPPQFKALELANGITVGTFSKVLVRGYEDLSRANMAGIARALRVAQHWLEHGGNDGPLPTGLVPPRPGTATMRHGDLPGWTDAVAIALAGPLRIPPEAYLAGGDCPVYRPIERISPEVATAIATYAWETSTFAEQARYSSIEAKRAGEVAAAAKAPKMQPPRRPIAK
jgi:hypothetical protein